MNRRVRHPIPFYKMSGSGNDFILIDNRRNILKNHRLSQLAKATCQHHLSIGGDGLIILESTKTRKVHFRWRLFNADGSEAEMSGNGGRCAARLAYLLGMAPQKMAFETLAGIVQAEVLESGKRKGAGVKIEMPPPKDLQLDIKISVNGVTHIGHFINTGVPHTVLFVENIKAVDVIGIGKQIRHFPLFQPAGTNVNFAAVKNPRTIHMRTYERGVEDETLACGTGAVATALVASALGHGRSPVTLRQKSGQHLRVFFSWDGHVFSNVFLEGDAKVIYSGEMWEEALG